MTGPAISLAEIVAYLDQYLRIHEVPDEPNAVNGLQVENRSGEVERIAAAVDASLATIQGVSGPGSLLIVHHGLFWDGNVPLTGRRYRRIAVLLERDVALYSAHLPLDSHPEVGNNAVLARSLGLTGAAPFDTYRGAPLGAAGVLEPAVPREILVGWIEGLLGCKARLIPGGPALCHNVGIITGGAGNRVLAAANAGLDTFITGEGPHYTYFDAIEFGINVIHAGHYATETVGVKALAAHLSSRFGIPWEFHDHPTGL